MTHYIDYADWIGWARDGQRSGVLVKTHALQEVKLKSSADSGTCLFSDVLRSPAVRRVLGYPFLNKTQVATPCISYHRTGSAITGFQRQHASHRRTPVQVICQATWKFASFERAQSTKGCPGGSNSKESACSAGVPGLIPGSGRSPGKGTGNALQYSCLGNSMDRGVWWVTVHGIAKSQTWLRD